MHHKNVQAAAKAISSFPQPDNSAFSVLTTEISVNKSHVWNSLEFQDIHANFGGAILPNRKLLDQSVNHLCDDLLVL
jgi:hypothetical protein